MTGIDQVASSNNGTVPVNTEENSLVDEKEFIMSCIAEMSQRMKAKAEVRATNQNLLTNRPSESSTVKLDSSLKKNTTFVKKLKNFSASQIETLLKDMSGLNLTKYISEVAAALVDAKLKMTDIAPVVKLCTILHHNYADFSQHLFENWQRVLGIKMGEKIGNPSKLRVDLRLYAELVNTGLFSNKAAFALLGNILTTLINMDKEEHCNISIILSFCRHCGEDYAGLVPKRISELAKKYTIEIPRSTLLPTEKQQNVRSLLRDYYISLTKHLVKDSREMQDFEKQNQRILQTKGELNQERKDKLESMRISYEKLLTTTQNFAEILGEDMPELSPEIPSKQEEHVILSVEARDMDDHVHYTTESIWCDVETRRFYCELPDLQAFLPSNFQPLKKNQKPEETVTEEVLDSDIPQDDLEEECMKSLNKLDYFFMVVAENNPNLKRKLKKIRKLFAQGKTEEIQMEEEVDDSQSTTVSNKIILDAFVNNLPNCINREMIDNSAIDFLVTLNNKHNRKKLVRSLFAVSRTRLDLLPFYARFVAILYPAVPEIATELCQMLRQDFKYHVRKKDQINIESKIKVVRYIGELVKFNLYSKIEALYCLKVLLHDFSHHHIEMACNLLEVCGRYLFCTPETHQRTKIYLEQMMRKKSVMALDSRYVTQIENAYYYVNPPENVTVPIKERPLMHRFIRKVLYQDLQKNNTDKILRIIRKLDWHNEDIAAYTTKCLTNAYNVKYFNIRCLANLLAGLVTYQEEVGTRVVDGVLEDIRLGMEVNLPKFYQKRVAQIKYLGELYNYRMVESADIFKVLYSLITFGVSMDYLNPSPLDPPDNLFRIRLACVLQETSGTYFSSGSSKRRLDYYLVFLQAYYWYKHSDPVWNGNFPISVEYLLRDTLLMLRPKLTIFESYEQAQQEVFTIKKNLGFDTCLFDNTNDKTIGGLECITETDLENDEENSEAANFIEETTTEDEGQHSLHESDDDANDLSDNEDISGGKDDTPPDGCEDISLALPSGPKYVNCIEDDDFVSALDRMVSDNIQERMRENVKPSQVDISVPLSVRSGKKTYEQLQDQEKDTLNTVDFTLMIRKGNKQVYRSFKANMNSELAQNLRDQEKAQLEEKLRVKRLTLNITERLEEEDYQEMLQQQQRPVTQNLNRERKKYQHPRGAPDADLIFGPKRLIKETKK